MTADVALFDMPAPELEDQDDVVELRDDDKAALSCLHCHVLTTVSGIVTRGHDGPNSATCTRLRRLVVEAGEWP